MSGARSRSHDAISMDIDETAARAIAAAAVRDIDVNVVLAAVRARAIDVNAVRAAATFTTGSASVGSRSLSSAGTGTGGSDVPKAAAADDSEKKVAVKRAHKVFYSKFVREDAKATAAGWMGWVSIYFFGIFFSDVNRYLLPTDTIYHMMASFVLFVSSVAISFIILRCCFDSYYLKLPCFKASRMLLDRAKKKGAAACTTSGMPLTPLESIKIDKMTSVISKVHNSKFY
jgi:hypothetical protein